MVSIPLTTCLPTFTMPLGMVWAVLDRPMCCYGRTKAHEKTCITKDTFLVVAAAPTYIFLEELLTAHIIHFRMPAVRCHAFHAYRTVIDCSVLFTTQ